MQKMQGTGGCNVVSVGRHAAMLDGCGGVVVLPCPTNLGRACIGTPESLPRNSRCLQCVIVMSHSVSLPGREMNKVEAHAD